MVAKTKMSIIEKTNHRRGSISSMGNDYMDNEIATATGVPTSRSTSGHKTSTSSKSPRGQGGDKEKHGGGDGASSEEEEEEAKWVACDGCGKWRRLPSTVDMSRLPEQVFYPHHHVVIRLLLL